MHLEVEHPKLVCSPECRSSAVPTNVTTLYDDCEKSIVLLVCVCLHNTRTTDPSFCSYTFTHSVCVYCEGQRLLRVLPACTRALPQREHNSINHVQDDGDDRVAVTLLQLPCARKGYDAPCVSSWLSLITGSSVQVRQTPFVSVILWSACVCGKKDDVCFLCDILVYISVGTFNIVIFFFG